MKLSSFIFALLLLLSVSLLSQEQNLFSEHQMSIEWSEVLELDDGEFYELIGVDDEYLYIKYKTRTTMFSQAVLWYAKLNKFDYSLIWKSSVDDFPEYLGLETNFVKDFYSEGAIQILMNAYDKRNDELFLLQMFVNTDGSFSKVYRISAIKTDDDDEGKILTSQDENSDEIVVGIIPQFEDEEENRLLFISVLDSSLSEVWSRELEFDFSYEHSTLIDFRAVLNGDVMVLLKVTPDEERGEEEIDDAPNEDYYLVKVSKDSALVNIMNLNLSHVWVSTIAFRNDNENGKTLVTGLYSNEDDDQTAGSFIINISQDSFEIVGSSENLFSAKELTPFVGEDDAKEGDEIETTFLLTDVFHKPDGGLITIFEDYQLRAQHFYDPNTMATSVTYTHFYGNIVVCNYNPDGTLAWHTVIPKIYDMSSSYYGSYLAVMLEKDLHIIYNDDDDNHEYWSGEEDDVNSVRLRNGVIAMVTLDEEGNARYQVMGDTRDDEKLYFAPRKGITSQSSTEDAFWISIYDEAFRLGKFTIIRP